MSDEPKQLVDDTQEQPHGPDAEEDGGDTVDVAAIDETLPLSDRCESTSSLMLTVARRCHFKSAGNHFSLDNTPESPPTVPPSHSEVCSNGTPTKLLTRINQAVASRNRFANTFANTFANNCGMRELMLDQC